MHLKQRQNENLKKHGGNIKRLAKKLGIDDENLLDFSSNINPYGPPPSVIDAVNRAVGTISEYPEQEAESLVAAIAGLQEIAESNIVAGNGTIELIHLLPQALESKKAVLLIPSFTEYELSIIKAGLETVYRKAYSSEEALYALRDSAGDGDMAIVGNPNNPCGYRIERDEMLAVIDSSPSCIWVIDEAFIDFTAGGDKNTLIKDAVARDNVVVLRSLTKIYSIAGLRLGYLAASDRIAGIIRAVKYPWSINSIAIEAGIAAIKDKAFVNESVALLSAEAQRLFEDLSGVNGIRPFMPAANYILVAIEQGMTAPQLQELLLHEGIAIRDCSTYTGLDDRYFRVAVKRPEDNKRLIEALRKVL